MWRDQIKGDDDDDVVIMKHSIIFIVLKNVGSERWIQNRSETSFSRENVQNLPPAAIFQFFFSQNTLINTRHHHRS